MKTEVYTIQPGQDASDAIRRAADALHAGGLVAFPTETVYGLAANAANDSAYARLRELKSRPDRPFTVHVARPDDVRRFVPEPPEWALRLMRKAWPGPLTIVLPIDGGLPAKNWPPGLNDRLVHEGTIGFRCPDHPVAERLLSEIQDPIVAPSANPAGQAPPTSGRDVLEKLDGQIDVLLDAGPTRWSQASTIIAFNPGGAYEILREGIYDRRMIDALLQRRLLFVCTGNTCRSPIAEGLARAALTERLGDNPDQLADRGWHVASAGTYGWPGAPASEEAVAAARELGTDISDHRSQGLTVELINSSDVIFCMAVSHVAEVVRMAPYAAGRTFLLDESGGIPDPIGATLGVYRQVALRIQQAIGKRMSEIVP